MTRDIKKVKIIIIMLNFRAYLACFFAFISWPFLKLSFAFTEYRIAGIASGKVQNNDKNIEQHNEDKHFFSGSSVSSFRKSI